jgi:hypothetical protein
MSSASSGRYQSRLFNFVHQQSRRVKQQCDRAFRNLQLNISWVASVGLHPLLQMFQSTRAAKQLHQTVQQSFPVLSSDNKTQSQTPPTVDTPIQKVLFAVNVSSEERELGVLGEKSLSPHNRLVIQGIATQLSNRNLVIISAQNEILDILTFQQQQKLQEQIIAAVADYWRYQRIAHSSPLTHHPILTFLDRTLAVVESNHLVPVSEVAITALSFTNTLSKRSWQLVQRLQTAFSASLSRGKSVAIAADVGSQTNTMRIQALIWAAIEYFFGVSGRQHLEQTTPKLDSSQSRFAGTPNSPTLLQSTSSPSQGKRLTGRRSATKLSSAKMPLTQLPPCPQSVESDGEDPWLSESDLFGDLVSPGEPATRSGSKHSRSRILKADKKTSLALPSRDVPPGLLYLVDIFRKFLPQPKLGSGVVKEQKINKGKLSAIDTDQSPPILQLPPRDRVGEISNQPFTQSTQIVPAPEWIETNATAMGYVKHPLEQLLAWLDQAMLWLEEVLLKIWQWVQHLGARSG